jgi:hypothetical protein
VRASGLACGRERERERESERERRESERERERNQCAEENWSITEEYSKKTNKIIIRRVESAAEKSMG